MQKGFKKDLLKILKNHRNLQRSALKVNKDNLKNFRSDSEPPRGFPKSFEDASEGEIKFKTFNKDLNEDQLETEWTQLRLKKTQQRLFQHIIYNYAQKENFYFKFFSFFKSVIYSLQDFNLWIKKMQKETEAETHLKKYWFNVKSFLWYQKILYLSKDYTLLTEVIKKHYDDFYMKHFKYEKTFKIIWRKIFWPVIHNDIQQYVKKYEICQRIKVLKQRFYRFLTVLPWFIILFREIFLNFIIKLPSSTLNE